MNGLDSSVVVYALDPTTAEHAKSMGAILGLEEWALTPTVVHEVYHTLVFRRGMRANDARSKLRALVGDGRTKFLNITKTVSLYSLDLASEFNLGGRDSLIAGCCLRNRVESLMTHDGELLKLGRVKFKGGTLAFIDPIGK